MAKEYISYSDKLRDPRWQKKRLKIMNRDKWTCKYCGDKKTTLNVHHLKYNGDPWNTEDKDLITCCEVCHQIISLLNKSGQTVIAIKKHKNDAGNTMLGVFCFSTKVGYAVLDFDDTEQIGELKITNTMNDEMLRLFVDIIKMTEEAEDDQATI